MCEVFIGLERELDMEISEEDCEQIHTLNELVEYLAKSAATKM
jgi:acyl carrier protein